MVAESRGETAREHSTRFKEETTTERSGGTEGKRNKRRRARRRGDEEIEERRRASKKNSRGLLRFGSWAHRPLESEIASDRN